MILADSHVIPILMFVEENPNCTRTQVYSKVARNINMPRKIEMLVSKGLLDQTYAGLSCKLRLTDTGKDVVSKIHEIDNIMKDFNTETTLK